MKSLSEALKQEYGNDMRNGDFLRAAVARVDGQSPTGDFLMDDDPAYVDMDLEGVNKQILSLLRYIAQRDADATFKATKG
jgi:hypothetical protein